MGNRIGIIKDFEGIIGAILGVVATLITTEMLKKTGKVDYGFKDWESTYYGNNGPYYEQVEKIEDATDYYYEFKLQLYNSSEIFKGLKDIYIEFCIKDKVVKDIPFDKDKTIYSSGFPITFDLNIINIPPKEIIELKLKGRLNNNVIEMKELMDLEKVYFVGKNHNGRKIRKLIIKYN